MQIEKKNGCFPDLDKHKIGSRVLVNTEELEAYMQRYKIQEDE